MLLADASAENGGYGNGGYGNGDDGGNGNGNNHPGWEQLSGDFYISMSFFQFPNCPLADFTFFLYVMSEFRDGTFYRAVS